MIRHTITEPHHRPDLGEGQGLAFDLSPAGSARCYGGGGGGSSSSSTSTENIDKRITAGGDGDIFALQDTGVTVAEGGHVNIITNDPASARAAIAAISGTGQEVLKTVSELSQQANASAQLVAKSQESFVEVASGQRATIQTVAVIVIAAVFGLFALRKK